MQDEELFTALSKSTVIDSEGRKVGPVGQLYLDDETQQPSWITARMGLFGAHEAFVPFQGARHEAEKEELHVPFTKAFIKGAPSVGPDQHLDQNDEAQLREYYQVSAQPAAPQAAAPQPGGPQPTDPQALSLIHI